MTSKKQQEARALREKGFTQSQIATELGISRRSVRERLGIVKAMEAFDLDVVPTDIWFKNKEYSVRVRPEQVSFIQQVKDAFHDLPRAPVFEATLHGDHDLMTIIPVFDYHLGLLAHASVSGEDYDLEIAATRLLGATAKLLQNLPRTSRAVIINGGDFTHQTDDLNRTRRSGHILDVAARNRITVQKAVQVTVALIEMVLDHSDMVEYFSVPGNHDTQNWETILIALSERYRDHDRVRIDDSWREFSALQHGKVTIFVHHGDKRTAKDISMFCAAEYAPLWGQTSYRVLFTGHTHHMKQDEFPGIYWTQLPSITPRDHYAASGGYRSISKITGFTYDLQGEVGSSTVIL